MPHLKAGELAPGIQALTAAKRRSVERVIAALDSALQQPDSTPPAQLVDRFRTFARLAKWNDPAVGIVPMSVNTLKAHINTVYPGGISEFQRARQRLISRTESMAARGGLREELRRLRVEHQMLINSVVTFSAQYLDLLRRAEDLAKTHKFLQAELRSHTRLYPNSHKRLQLVGKR